MQLKRIVFWTAIALAPYLAACHRAGEPHNVGFDGAAGGIEAGDIELPRQEAQPSFDAARARVASKDLSVAAREVRDAAAFTRAHADSSAGAVRSLLLTSARELESLASSIENGSVRTTGRLDVVFARTQYAEAEFHFARAGNAWAARHTATASDELTMAVDHFERAAKDAGVRIDARSDSTIREVRRVARVLRYGEPVQEAEYASIAKAFDVALRSLSRRVIGGH